MYFLLFIVAIIAIYVASFKENFRQENIEKAVPVICIFALITFVACIASSILGGR